MTALDAYKSTGDLIWDLANLLRGPSEIPFTRPLDQIKANIAAMLKEVPA